jgi:hypothetical protein
VSLPTENERECPNSPTDRHALGTLDQTLENHSEAVGAVIKDANIGGDRHLVIDIACTHELCGNIRTDVTRNGQLCDSDVNKLLETTARTKAALYREAYANLLGTTYAFLPCVMSTSGQIHGEFLRLLYILAHRRTEKYFAEMGDHEPGTDAFM